MKDKSSKARMQVIFGLLLFALVFMAELYTMINFRKMYPAIAGFAVVDLICLYMTANGLMKLYDQKDERREEQYESIFKSEKASYIMLKKYFEEVAVKLRYLEEASKIPTEEIVNAQKGIAKVIIKRSHENTEALMNSYEQIMDEFGEFQKDIQGFSTVAGSYKDEVLAAQKNINIDGGVQIEEIEDLEHRLELKFENKLDNKMQDMIVAIKDMELRLNQLIMSSQKVVVSTPVATESIPAMQKQAAVSEPATQTIPEPQMQAAPEVKPMAEPAAPVMPEAEVAAEPVPEPKAEPEIMLDPDLEPAVEEEIGIEPEAGPEITLDPDLEPVSEPEITLDSDLEPAAGEEIGIEPEPEAEPEITLDPDLEPVAEDEIGIGPEPEAEPQITLDPDLEPVAEKEIGIEPEAVQEPPVMAAEEVIPPDPEEYIEEAEQIAEPEPVPEAAVVEEAAPEEKTPMPDMSDPNRAMSPDEIAALFANMGSDTKAGQEEQPVEPEPIPEPEPVPAQPAEPADPNKPLSPDEIAALFASMGT